MRVFCIIFLALISLSFCQTPPSWGGNPRYTVKVKMLNDAPVATWNFMYYYDWNLKAERYEHDAPQEDEMCLLPTTSFKKDGIPCVVTFATDGWSYISFPSQNFCCKCSKSFGAVRYDWLKTGSSYVGIETVDGKSVTHWTKQGQYLNHFYSTVDKELPVRFFEIKNGHPKSWDFDLSTYSTGPIDPDKLKPQCTTQCAGYCSQLVQDEEGNLQVE